MRTRKDGAVKWKPDGPASCMSEESWDPGRVLGAGGGLVRARQAGFAGSGSWRCVACHSPSHRLTRLTPDWPLTA